MKVLHLAPHCDDSGNGVVNVAVDLACAQADSGNCVSFASAGGSFAAILNRHNVECFILPENRIVYLPAILRGLRRLLVAFDPDIVHAHMIPGALLARLLRGRLRFRLVTTIHNRPGFRASLMGVGDLVISVSAYNAEEMKRCGFPRHKLRVVRNGPCGSPRRTPLDDIGSGAQLRHPAIVTVAGLFPYKGISDLIEAFAQLSSHMPTAELYIIGDGPARARFAREAARKDCADRIKFLGFVRDPRPFLRSADVFVLASRQEAFGLVVAEAREAACAIVATNVGGIPEALDGGSAGILVPSRSPHILAQVLLDVLQNAERRRWWRCRAATNLGWLDLGRATAETLGVYRETLQQV